jgi:hypothetical protein
MWSPILGLDLFGMAVKKESDPESHFVLITTLHNGIPVYISRIKLFDRYMHFSQH